ncbi:MAG: hypothetical protein ACR5LG_00135 [Sodalis sp. (in: enterobacteria)]
MIKRGAPSATAAFWLSWTGCWLKGSPPPWPLTLLCPRYGIVATRARELVRQRQAGSPPEQPTLF